MPSLFDALGNAAAGYTNEFNQTRQFNEQKRLNDAELARQKMLDEQQQTTFQQQQEDRQRNRGIDPATGQPFIMPLPLTQIRPNNQGKGGPASLQDLYTHYSKLADYYTSTGQTDRANIALTNAAETARQLAAAQTQAAEFARTEYTQGEENLRQQYALTHQTQALQQRESFEDWLRQQPTYADLHGGRTHVNPDQAAEAKAKWYEEWAKATTGKPGKLKYPDQPAGPGNPLEGVVAPLIPRQLVPVAGKMFSAIDAAPDPIAKASELANATANPSLKALLISRGRAAAMGKQAAGYGGGSEGDQNFIPPSPWP